jgi:hypothetical protein
MKTRFITCTVAVMISFITLPHPPRSLLGSDNVGKPSQRICRTIEGIEQLYRVHPPRDPYRLQTHACESPNLTMQFEPCFREAL